MAASQEHVYVYPDPTMFGLSGLPPLQISPFTTPIASDRSSIPMLTAPTPPFAIDPALLEQDRLAAAGVAAAPVPAPFPAPIPVPALGVAGPAPAHAQVPGNIPATRPSAAGLQPFPELVLGLQAPIELTDTGDVTLWNKRLDGSIPL